MLKSPNIYIIYYIYKLNKLINLFIYLFIRKIIFDKLDFLSPMTSIDAQTIALRGKHKVGQHKFLLWLLTIFTISLTVFGRRSLRKGRDSYLQAVKERRKFTPRTSSLPGRVFDLVRSGFSSIPREILTRCIKNSTRSTTSSLQTLVRRSLGSR